MGGDAGGQVSAARSEVCGHPARQHTQLHDQVHLRPVDGGPRLQASRPARRTAVCYTTHTLMHLASTMHT